MQPKPDNCTIVIFGASGDLAARKLFPSLFDLALWGHLSEEHHIVGVGRAPLTQEQFRAMVASKMEELFPERTAQHEAFQRFLANLHYSVVDLAQPEDYIKLRQHIEQLPNGGGISNNLLFYLAIPPTLAPQIVQSLHTAGLGEADGCPHGWRKIMVEKPYGTNLESARELNQVIGNVFREKQVYRIDHYLAKETVQNIMVFRFSNGMFEPLWNRQHIANVTITIAENFGIRDRGAFYEDAGLLRDIMQNHALQLLAAVAMEPPVDFSADAVRDEKAKVLRSIRPFTAEQVAKTVVLGQYEGYRQEKNVAPNSTVETFAAIKFFIDNWRWKDVPFYIRAGKNLAQTLTEIVITFQCPPQNYFGPTGSEVCTANQVILRIQPEETIAVRFGAKRPGESVITDPVSMTFDYKTSFVESGLTPYHRLLLDAMAGEQMNFIRQDSVEYSWGIIDAIRQAVAGQQPESYPVHSYGPAGISRLYE
uniref:Glucose-6-phosphate 1-dehydrogenase n=1 Tax=Chlorobium chlorochromatii (strain CaD3) TaxID=340177 RepID=Q3AQ05_CHLCH